MIYGTAGNFRLQFHAHPTCIFAVTVDLSVAQGRLEKPLDEIVRLVAIEEIKSLKARYFRGVDTKDWPLLASVFADDVICDYCGSATDPSTGVNYAPAATAAPLQGSALVIEAIKRSLHGIVSTHQGYLPEIDIVSEAEARATWGMYDALRFPPSSPLAELSGFGHYHESYEKIGGHWRIKSLKLVRLRVDTKYASNGEN
jgi:hypothetical protein